MGSKLLVNGVHRGALEALADSLQLDLTVSARGDVYGSDKFRFEVPALGLKGKMETKVESSFTSANGEDVGLLVKIAGDLILYAFATEFDDQVKILVLDGSKMSKKAAGFFEALQIRSWRTSIKFLGTAVVAAYGRNFKEATYKKLATATL